MTDDTRDQSRTRETNFAAIWSSDGVTRSMSATGSPLPADLPFLFAAGQRFGAYEIVRPLGKGGMGQVYEAEEIESGRRIALKLLSRGLGDDEERERFLSEGRLAASLSHPNCVYVFGTSEIQGFPVIAMELVPQGTLKDLVIPGQPMTAAAAVDAILQVMNGLDAAASIGILHRDIKPSNCFVHREGRVLVGDFGLSVAATGHGQTRGSILGTPGFASPEQLRGDPLDVRSDIYSVGATLFYLLAGRPPFDDRNTTDLLAKVAAQPAPSLLTTRPDLPRRLAYVVSRCLAKLPEERFASYAALSAALEPFSSARLKHAPIVRRALAGWIDSNIVAIPTVISVKLAGLITYSTTHLTDSVLMGAIAAAVMTLYYGVLEGHWGATAGKALFGLRVVNRDRVAPGIAQGIRRALAFALPAQIVLLIARLLILRQVPEIPIRMLDAMCVTIYLALLFSTARRSNGWQALHDRFTSTRVVRRRERVEARHRAPRAMLEEHAPFESDARVGPYLVPLAAPLGASSIASIEGFDDRLHRRVWIDLLPAGSAPLDAARRDLDRPARVRWLGGKRQAGECWDAYEAVDGAPVDEALSTPQPWARVRHWISDLAREIAAGLPDGSLPPLRAESVWIGRDDRARLVEWWRRDGILSRAAGESADLASAQRLLYGVAVAALLGVRVEEAMTRSPATPLPLSARTLLLSLRDGKFATAAGGSRPSSGTDAMLDAVSAALASPAAVPRQRRAAQIAASASFPLAMAIGAVGAVLWAQKSKDAAEVQAMTWTGLYVLALATAAGSFVVTMFFSGLGALVTGSGFTFRPSRAALVNRRGERASRLRALWRAAVTWSPVAAALAVIAVSPSPPAYQLSLLALETALMTLVICAAAWAISHPSQSIQDRLSGTWIVPR